MRLPKRLILLVLLAGLLSSGCQTFNLTKEEFETQQRGRIVDSEIGDVVTVFGTFGYLGAAIGAVVAGAK